MGRIRWVCGGVGCIGSGVCRALRVTYGGWGPLGLCWEGGEGWIEGGGVYIVK